MGFLRDDDHFLLMDNPPVFPGWERVGNRSFTRDDFKRLADAGIRTVVEYTNWDLIEPQMGVRNWSYLDRAIEDAQAAGLKVLLSDCTWGTYGLPREWYRANTGGPVLKLGQLSFWNADAMDYLEGFIRELASRYACDTVNLFSTQANYGEQYIEGEIHNAFYDQAALASFRDYTGDPHASPMPYNGRIQSNPATEAWYRQSIIEAMCKRNRLIMDLNGREEIWTSAHHLWAYQGAGSGAQYIRDVLDAYVATFPGVKINGINYTYWVHGNNFNYAPMLDQDIDKYGIDFYVGAEYCEGIPVFLPHLLKSKIRGFIVAPFSVLTNHSTLEDWMLDNIRHACKEIGAAMERCEKLLRGMKESLA